MAGSSLTASPSTVLTEICNPQLPMSKTDGETNTNISDPANCDDEELKVSIRLGGILPSDDEEEDVINNRSCEAAPASPLSTTETATNTVSENTLDESLQSQIATLQEIAAMESREYQQRLMENSVDTTDLQDRSFMQLNQSLHRFHSVILNLNEENDSQTQEILRLQAQEMESQNKIAKLEAVVSKLLAQNQRLRKKKRAEKSINRRLVEHLQNINNAQQQEEETIDRLLQHEQNLRERCDSSNFSSDLEGFDTESVYSMASNRSLVTSEPPTVRIHRERNMTWPHSDFADGDAVTTPDRGDKKQTAEGKVEDYHHGSPARSNRYSDEASHKICEGRKSVSTADVWKASMRPSSPSHNFWANDHHHHDPLHKVDRSNILDLGEYDDINDVRRKAADEKNKKQEEKKKKDIEPAFVHDFKVMFGKSPQKRRSTGEKFDLFDMFKKDDVKGKSNGNEGATSATRNSTMSATHQYDHKTPSKTNNKRESKTSIALDNAKLEAQEAADKIKSSMKTMGKMFKFMDKP